MVLLPSTHSLFSVGGPLQIKTACAATGLDCLQLGSWMSFSVYLSLLSEQVIAFSLEQEYYWASVSYCLTDNQILKSTYVAPQYQFSLPVALTGLSTVFLALPMSFHFFFS